MSQTDKRRVDEAFGKEQVLVTRPTKKTKKSKSTKTPTHILPTASTVSKPAEVAVSGLESDVLSTQQTAPRGKNLGSKDEHAREKPKNTRRQILQQGAEGAARGINSREDSLELMPGAASVGPRLQKATKKKLDDDRVASNVGSSEARTDAGNTSSSVSAIAVSKSTAELDSGSQVSRHPISSNLQAGRSKRKGSHMHQDWNLSTSSGGAFIDHDPILTADGAHIILPTTNSVQIHSLRTSLRVRSLEFGRRDDVMCCSIHPQHPNRLIVGLASGSLTVWDWTLGRRLSTTGASNKLVALATGQSGADKLFTVRYGNNEKLSLSQTKLGAQNVEAGSDVLLEHDNILGDLKVFEQLGVIVACSRNKIHIGYAQPTSGPVSALIWRDVSLPGRITCFDVRAIPSAQKSGPRLPVVNVAVGLSSGLIQVHDDLLSKIVNKEKTKQTSISGKHLHWHRKAVNTVKWSRDGNYLVSGGEETVLVIWQLETNQKQFLPHLSTPILNLTISQAGSAYAVRLGDNSVMVLSTADLQPFANITGLSLGHMQYPAADLNPLNRHEIALAISTDSVSRGRASAKAATLLQSYDLQNGLELNRQALTRTLATTVKVGPDGKQLREPNVSHLSFSHDGKWLATVDQWSPNPEDMQASYLHGGDETSVGRAGESYLRLWTLNDASNDWGLSSRIDNPVEGSPSRVLALIAHPTRLGFATAGTDGHVKFWSPKARLRSGQPVRNKAGERLLNWSCSSSIYLDPSTHHFAAMSADNAAALAYSEDGSVLAASWSPRISSPPSPPQQQQSQQPQTLVHFVDARTGKLRSSKPNIITSNATGAAQIAFSGRYLLTLSDEFCIFDTLSMQKTFCLSLGAEFIHASSRNLLARNLTSGTVAIATNPNPSLNPRSRVGRAGRIVVYDIASPEKGPLYDVSMPSQTRVLLASKTNGDGGYVIVDGDARVHQLSPPRGSSSTAIIASSTLNPVAKTNEVNQPIKNLGNVFGTGSASGARPPEQLLLEGGAHEGEVRLENILDVQTSAENPALTDLFAHVARVVSGLRA